MKPQPATLSSSKPTRSVKQIRALAEALPAVQQTAFFTQLDAYVAGERGWHAGVTALADLATLAPRYEPSGRQWAMRLLADVQGLAVAELYRTALRVGTGKMKRDPAAT